MQPDEVLAHESRVLTQEQREFYFENGYLLVEAVVPPEWLEGLRAVTDEMGDSSRPGTHAGELYSQYDDKGQWVGCLSEADAKGVATETAAELTGPAGSITIHNCRVVHGSRPNHADAGRPLLLNVYSAADAFPYTANPLPSSHAGEIVRGGPARWAHHGPRPCLVPPDWSAGYTSLFALQQQESWEDVQSQA